MKIYVDGGCRRNGFSNAIAAASAVRKTRWGGKYWYKTRRLYAYRKVSNQRAELTAIILGLEMALEKFDDLDSNPNLDVTIYSDSRYAVDCMTDFIYKWTRNGWINSRGEEVANRDLIEEASDLDDRLAQLGTVTYSWIPRSENSLADRHCNEELDAME
jgi:ribonuclease HI